MELRVKQEETLEPKTDHHGDDFDNTPEVISIKEEEAHIQDYLCKTSGAQCYSHEFHCIFSLFKITWVLLCYVFRL